ncbi:MAG: SEC-C domain-containing protein [Candidatus Sabulitectum sp.]|nr:SEC-C domain-containing protein [Candidatus Sabulitectum sp.]
MITPKVSLFAPCHCGSGRKYKNCCWKAEKREYARGRSAASSVINDVFAFLNHEYEFDKDVIVDTIMSSACDCYNHDYVLKVLETADGFMTLLFNDTGVADYMIEPGKTVIDLYLEEKRNVLHPMAVEFLQGWRKSGISLYRVKSVDLRKSLTVTDLLSKKTVTVSDNERSDILNRGDTFFGRVVKTYEEYLFSPVILPVHPRVVDGILEEFREEKASIPRSKTVSWRCFFKKNWEIIPEYWLEEELYRHSERSVKFDTEGDSVSHYRFTFNLFPGNIFQVRKQLLDIPGMKKNSETEFDLVFDLSNHKTVQLDTLSIASLTLTDSSLVMTPGTASIAEYVLSLLTLNLEEYIEDIEHEILYRDSEQVEGDQNDEFTIPPHIEKEFFTELLDRYYRNWFDTPIPALNGLSPRESAKSPESRKYLTLLLKKMDLLSLMDGIVFYDSSWLWEELGLEREQY